MILTTERKNRLVAGLLIALLGFSLLYAWYVSRRAAPARETLTEEELLRRMGAPHGEPLPHVDLDAARKNLDATK